MGSKNLYKNYVNYLCRKAVLVPVLFFLIIMFLFTFSCSLTDDSTTASGNDTSTDQTVEESQDAGQEQVTGSDIDENSDGDEDIEGEEEIESGELTINVYYSDAMGEYLVAEARVVSSENKYIYALNELMKLPVDANLHRLVPDSTKINSIVVEDGLAKVDFSKEFIEDKITSDTEDNLLIYSIVNTLTEFQEVNSVSFYIDGEKLDVLGMVDISEPVFRRSDLIK
jgi:germination protein M